MKQIFQKIKQNKDIIANELFAIYFSCARFWFNIVINGAVIGFFIYEVKDIFPNDYIETLANQEKLILLELIKYFFENKL